jgi:hypothetical protein
MTLLEPTDYWRRVPPRWKPYWHFHNIPVQSDVSHADSPLRYVRQLASPQDFVVRGVVSTVEPSGLYCMILRLEFMPLQLFCCL